MVNQSGFPQKSFITARSVASISRSLFVQHIDRNGCSLVASGIAKGTEAHGSAIQPWRIEFFVTGILIVLIGSLFIFIMPVSQLNARWLVKDESLTVVESIRIYQRGIGTEEFKMYQLKEIFVDTLI